LFLNQPPFTNNSPYQLSNPSPTDGATGITINPTLNWTGGDPDSDDTVNYDIYFGTSSNPPLVSSDENSTTYNPGTLSYPTTYYWKIVARENHSAETTGSVRSFITTSKPNSPPVLSSIGNKTVAEGQTLSFSIAGSDPDGDSLSYSASNLPSGASFSGQTFSWTPNYDQAGTYAGVHFEVSDSKATDSEDITITVTNVNRKPIANAQSVSTDEDTPVNVTLSGSDPDGDSLSYTVVTQPDHGTLTGNVPNLKYTPTANYTGNDSFTFKVNDRQVDSADATVTITVTPINDPPVAKTGSDQIVTTGSKVIIDGSKSYDPDGNPLNFWDFWSWSMVSMPNSSKAKVGSKSTTQYFTPDVDGTYIIQLIVSDGILESTPDTVKITALGLKQYILISTNQSSYASGDTLELYVWVGNSSSAQELKADTYLGFGLPDGSLYFFDPALNLKPSDPHDPRTFTPFASNATLAVGWVFPGPNEMNADIDGNGKPDIYLLYSVILPPFLPAGPYFAFAALTEPGSVQAASPRIIGEITISSFTYSP
jgi:hypothetical protein